MHGNVEILQSPGQGDDSGSGSDDDGFTLKVDPWPLLPDGFYEVNYMKMEKGFFRGTKKLYVIFKVVSQGEHFGQKLFRAYNFYEPIRVGSDLCKDLILLYGRPARKNTRLSLSLFKGKILKVKVKSVKKDRDQLDVALHQQYSVISRIVSVEAGGTNVG